MGDPFLVITTKTRLLDQLSFLLNSKPNNIPLNKFKMPQILFPYTLFDLLTSIFTLPAIFITQLGFFT